MVQYGEDPIATGSFGPSIQSVSVSTVGVNKGGAESHGTLLNVSVKLQHAVSLHFADGPECDGCCRGRTTPYTPGVPTTGDSWGVGFAGGGGGGAAGSTATVCKDKTLGCDGAANLRADGSVDWLVLVPNTTASISTAPAVAWVGYGGGGPMLGQADNVSGGSAVPFGCGGRWASKRAASTTALAATMTTLASPWPRTFSSPRDLEKSASTTFKNPAVPVRGNCQLA